MTAIAWPAGRDWEATRFEMRVMPNVRSFSSPLSPSSTQVVDLGGDYWMASLDLGPVKTSAQAAEREAFFDRLNGGTNTVLLWHLKRPVPRGTMGDGTAATWSTTVPSTATWSTSGALTATWFASQPHLAAAVAAGATSLVIQTIAGRTLLAGDQVGVVNGQCLRNMADATADGAGLLTVEVRPAVRSALGIYSAVTFNRPTVSFRVNGEVPVTYRPGYAEAISIDLIESV